MSSPRSVTTRWLARGLALCVASAFVAVPPQTKSSVRRCLPSPSPELSDEATLEVVLAALGDNDSPRRNAGLEVCFRFSNDMCRAAVGGSLEAFLAYAQNPTFGSLVGHLGCDATLSSRVAGARHRGALSAFVVDVHKKQGGHRKFLFTLEKQRRPPLTDCWLVRECLALDKAIYQTI